MSKWFWIILAVVVAGLIGVFAVANQSNNSPSAPIEDPQQIRAEDHVRGPADAKVTLIEYGDFQCPACKTAFPLVQRLGQDFPEQLRLVFRHYPLTAIHPNAFAAARAAEAASGQGKFFEMHDLLYEKQEEWATDPAANNLFRDYAQQLGLDIGKFNEVYNSANTTDWINNDIKIGQSLDVSSTPTFYINGEKVEPNPRSYEEFKAKIEALL